VEAVRAARAVTPEDPVRPDSRGRLQITAHGEAQKLKRTKIKPKRRVAAGVRVVGSGWQEVEQLLRSWFNGVQRRAGRREAGQYIHRGFGRTKNKTKHLHQSTQEYGLDTAYHLNRVCHVKYVG
jgi:hypothetical protein